MVPSWRLCVPPQQAAWSGYTSAGMFPSQNAALSVHRRTQRCLAPPPAHRISLTAVRANGSHFLPLSCEERNTDSAAVDVHSIGSSYWDIVYPNAGISPLNWHSLLVSLIIEGRTPLHWWSMGKGPPLYQWSLKRMLSLQLRRFYSTCPTCWWENWHHAGIVTWQGCFRTWEVVLTVSPPRGSEWLLYMQRFLNDGFMVKVSSLTYWKYKSYWSRIYSNGSCTVEGIHAARDLVILHLRVLLLLLDFQPPW